MPERLFLRLHDELSHGPETRLPAGRQQVREASPALRPWVAGLMHYREDFGNSQDLSERVVPDAALRLVIPLDGSGPPLLIGLSTRPALLPLRGRIEGLSLTLQAGAASALLRGVPAAELREQALPLDLFWRGEAARLQDSLLGSAEDERLARLEAALRRQLAGALPDSRSAQAVALLAAQAETTRPVAALVTRSGYSERRLQQLFSAELGLPPKTYSRLLRLHASLRRLRHRVPIDWAALALAGAYADQSHLVHEFRRFTGLTPTAWQARYCGNLQDGRPPAT
jgi:AraC-like DNA-binding protein